MPAKPDILNAWAETGNKTDPGVTKVQNGWISEIPTYQNFNWILNRQDVFSQHVNERGIPEWDASTKYIKNSLVTGSDGNVYKSIVNPNTGNDPVGDGGVNESNTNWILYNIDLMWVDMGDTPVYVSSTRINIPGNRTSIYKLGSRIKLNGVATGNIYAEIVGVSYSAPDTLLLLVVDEDTPLSSDTFNYIKISSFIDDDNNLPFGLSGMAESNSSKSANSELKYVSYAGGTKVKGVKPSVNIVSKLSPTKLIDYAGDYYIDTDFIKIKGITTEGTIQIQNLSLISYVLRFRINRGSWNDLTLAAGATTDLILGLNGFAEFSACNLNKDDPRYIDVKCEVDPNDYFYFIATIAKNY